MPTIYIETSIVSHAAARPSGDPHLAELRTQARDWWRIERPHFELFTSQIVINEASAGDPDAASERLVLLDGIPLVPVDAHVPRIADELLAASLMPQKAAVDALHVAAAAHAGIEYLLTQNCRHIANAHVLPRIYRTLEKLGFGGMLVCTPEEFLGGLYDATQSNT